MIRPIDKWSVNQITSGQVVTSLSSAVKELVENSLDAGASVIDIQLVSHGRGGFSVTDNGHGIEPEDFDFISYKHATSKLESFEDLGKVSTLGFRGEALASLCALANVTITTNSGSEPTGYELTIDQSGKVANTSKVVTARGTRISVTNLFENLPVRRKTFERNSSREFAKTVELIQEYALLNSARITVEHVSNGRTTTTLRSQGTKLIHRIACVYGAKRTKTLEPIELKGSNGLWHASGYISKPIFGMGVSGSTCQLLAVNGRPIQQSRLSRAIVETYKQYNFVEQPFFIFDLRVPPEMYDINVSPDKRHLLLHGEDVFIADFRYILESALDSSGHSVPRSSETPTFPAKQAKQSLLSFASFAGTGTIITQKEGSPPAVNFTSDAAIETAEFEDVAESPDLEHSNLTGMQDSTVSRSDRVAPASTEVVTDASNSLTDHSSSMLSQDSNTCNDFSHHSRNDVSSPVEHDSSMSLISRNDEVSEVIPQASHDELHEGLSDSPSPLDELCEDIAYVAPQDEPCEAIASISDESFEDIADLSSHGSVPASPLSTIQSPAKTSTQSSPQAPPKSPTKSAEPVSQQLSQSKAQARQIKTLNTHIHLPVSIGDIERSMEEASQSQEKSMKRLQNLSIDEDGVEERLQLSIRKQDFDKMEIVGQFNLGFILVVNRKTNHDDLFVIDQHASDEIYNFERLQSTTVMSRQPLVIPHVLELSAAEELTVQNNLSVFENNGFSIIVNEKNPPGRQCLLVSVPFSKSTVFDENDVLELLGKIKEDPERKCIRCSKLRAMFAMRACRSSIMVGRPLTAATMEAVVRHMGTLDKPWNCPHGRPTLRHITTLS